MSNVRLHILGAGSAKPTKILTPSGQVLQMCDKQFLIDCGEGTQINMEKMGLRTPRLDHIFISHTHGDHCFGLPGLLSTWGMLGRTRSITIHAQPDLERLLRPWLDYFCTDMSYEVRFHHINPAKHEVIYEDRTLTVTTLPLKHKVPCCGFLFQEKQRPPHIRKELIEQYSIPIAEIAKIKDGGDFLMADGITIPNADLTYPSEPPYSYAYCSDTAYSEKLIPLVAGVNCLYHEATFSDEYLSRCKDTMHSTARQAADVALKAGADRLIIGHYSSRITDFDRLLAEAQAVFPATDLAHDRTTFRLKD